MRRRFAKQGSARGIWRTVERPSDGSNPPCPDCKQPTHLRASLLWCETIECPAFDLKYVPPKTPRQRAADSSNGKTPDFGSGDAGSSPASATEDEIETDPLVLADARREGEQTLFRESPFYAIQRGWVMTEDEHAKSTESPKKSFPAKDYVKAIVLCHQRFNVGMVMKSRQLMFSWLFCWMLLWKAIVRDSQLCIAQGKREEDVIAKGTKALMGRIRFMRRNLPKQFQPVVTEETKTTEVYANNSTIWAIPQGEDVIRSNTASEIFLDELARHAYGEQAWTAALPTVRGGGSLWGVTTPNGREFCYQQGDERLPYDAWESWPEITQGVHGYQNAKGIFLMAVHYTADPDQRSVTAQVERRKGYTNGNFYRQENEIDFSMTSGMGVYAEEFREELHVLRSPYVPNPYMPIYRAWDFGYNGQACCFFQYNHRGQLVWFDTVFLKRVALPKVCAEVQRRTILHTHFDKPGETTEIAAIPLKDLEGHEIEGAYLAQAMNRTAPGQTFDFGDPNAEAHNADGTTARDTLLTFGFTLRSRSTVGRKADLVEGLRVLLLPRSDGTPGLLVSPGPSIEQRYVIDGFKGGYQYPPVTLGRADKMLPHKDGFYDHMFDACQYGIDHVRPIRAAQIAEFGEAADWWRDAAGDNPWNSEEQFHGAD